MKWSDKRRNRQANWSRVREAILCELLSQTGDGKFDIERADFGDVADSLADAVVAEFEITPR